MRATKIMHDITVQKLWDKLERLEKSVEYFEENGVHTGFKVYYQVDTNEVYTEEATPGSVIILPTTFTPEKEGYTFVGWKKDTVASGDILTGDNEDSKMHTEDVVLYAVFSNPYTISYEGNGSTSGSTEAQIVNGYYNNGNTVGGTVTLPSNGFTRTNATFYKWAILSVSGDMYDAGDTVTVTADTTFYAKWAVATTKTGQRDAAGKFQDGWGPSTVWTSFGVTFMAVPKVTTSYGGSGHWGSHSNGGGCQALNISTTGFDFKCWENSNGGNNYNYGVTWSWTATGNVLV